MNDIFITLEYKLYGTITSYI